MIRTPLKHLNGIKRALKIWRHQIAIIILSLESIIRPSVEAPQEANKVVHPSIRYLSCFSVGLVYLAVLSKNLLENLVYES